VDYVIWKVKGSRWIMLYGRLMDLGGLCYMEG
jgi:hypothetical protein